MARHPSATALQLQDEGSVGTVGVVTYLIHRRQEEHMFFEKSTVRKARTRGKILGFFHAEQGKTVSGEALTDLAHAESFAFVYTSRLLSRFASCLRSVYENAFVEEYTAIVTTPPG